jgi:peptidylprolyl isomerase
MTEIKEGDQVQIHFTGRFEDGTVFDSSEGRGPLEFTAGGDEVIAGVSQAVIGMKPGDSKTVQIPPEQGFGERNPEQVQRVDRGMLPEDVQVGTALQAQSEDGSRSFTVWVAELDEQSALLDANHPLSGRNLEFDIELVGTK